MKKYEICSGTECFEFFNFVFIIPSWEYINFLSHSTIRAFVLYLQTKMLKK